MRTLIFSVAMLAGCSTPPTVWEYQNGMRIVRADQYLMAQACGAVEGKYDDGTLRRKGEAGRGCYDRKNDTIYVEDSRAIIHELAHRDGVKDPDAAGYKWK